MQRRSSYQRVGSTDEMWGGFGTNVGARTFKDKSTGGTPGGSGEDGPLARIHVESIVYAVAELLPRGRIIYEK